MTAVFGVVGEVHAAELAEMGRRLAHRGEKQSIWEVAPGVWFGQRSEAEPALHRHERAVAVVDAPRALAAEVQAGDIPAAWQSEGARGLARLNVPYAFALWDGATGTLFLSRDPAGMKPLYVTRLPKGGVAFATEYKSLLAIAAVPAEIDRNALQYLQVFKLTPPGTGTLLKGIEAVRANAVTQYDSVGTQLSVQTLPDVTLAVQPRSPAAAAAELREHLMNAVRRLVSGKSRVAVALSGGVDSLGLAHLCRECAPAAELVGYNFSQGADDPEAGPAAAAMRVLGGRLATISVTGSEMASRLPAAVWHLEDPVGRTESFLFFEVARRARQDGFDTLLSGMGADALFAGMPRYQVLWLAHRLPWLRDDLLEFYDATQTGKAPRRMLARAFAYAHFRGGVPHAPTIKEASMPESSPHPEPGPELVNRTLAADVLDHGARSLPRIERPLYTFGLEHASPFFDRRVIDFAFTLSDRLKLRLGKEKLVLRQALQPLMSDELRNTHKGLMRMRQDSQFTQALQRLSERYLSREAIEQRNFFDPTEIGALRAACAKPGYHHERAMRLWTVLLSEIWAQTFLDGRGAAPLPA